MKIKEIYSRRTPLGNYPKWAGRLIKWGLSKKLPKDLKIVLRGRRPDWGKIAKDGAQVRYGKTAFGGDYLPLQYAKRVGIYIVSKKQVVYEYERPDNIQ